MSLPSELTGHWVEETLHKRCTPLSDDKWGAGLPRSGMRGALRALVAYTADLTQSKVPEKRREVQLGPEG